MKLYTEIQVAVASFLGSPIAGGILMARNESVAGRRSGGRRFLVLSVAATCALVAVGFFLPERRAANYLGPLIGAWGMRLWYRKAQGDYLTKQFPDAIRASWWK